MICDVFIIVESQSKQEFTVLFKIRQTVQQTYSLDRTYILFRSLGLRHLVVVDQHNRPTGIITRKDLMGFKIEEKLEAVIEKVKSGESASSGAAATPKHDDGVEMQDTSGSGQQHLNPAYDADA